jgi:hypothetical protein
MATTTRNVRPRHRSRGRLLSFGLILGIASALAVGGWVTALPRATAPERVAQIGETVDISDGALRVEEVLLESHVHSPGMPAGMMADAVEAGLQRFTVMLTLAAGPDTSMDLSLERFTVATSAHRGQLVRGEIGAAELPADSGIRAPLVFDAPDAGRVFLLVDGKVAVELDTLDPTHPSQPTPGSLDDHQEHDHG